MRVSSLPTEDSGVAGDADARRRLRILWLPHTPTDNDGWEGSRQYHLLRQLARRHDVHWISWRQSKRLLDARSWGAWKAETDAVGTMYTINLAPNFYRLFTKRYPKPIWLLLNQILFRRAIAAIHQRVRPDVAVFSASYHFTGFPPFDLGAPLVFDYVDKNEDFVEKKYIANAPHVMAVSRELADAAASHGKHAVVVPNGVNLDSYTRSSSAEAKEKLGLSGLSVISLIGLTCSATCYFVDAVALLQRTIPDLALLIVGGGNMRDRIAARAAALGVRNFHAVGAVPHSAIHSYFRATDVGLYPGEDIPYYREASPLKIVEYVAAGARVVSSPVNMFRSGWPGVSIAEPTPDAFADAIRAALAAPPAPMDLRAYDWSALAGKVEDCLYAAVAASPQKVVAGLPDENG